MSQPTTGIPVFALCDAASVREGLLHMLGAGISNIHRDGDYPSALGAVLAGIVQFSGEQSEPPRLVLRITTFEGESIGMEDLQLGPGPEETYELDDDQIYTIPIVVDVSSMELPAPGKYKIQISTDDGVTSSIAFSAD